MLRYQNQMRLSRDSRPQRQMPRMASHHFNDLHPAMRSGGRARVLDDLRYVSQRRIEPKRVVSTREIFVDRLRHTDDGHTLLRELRGDAECIFTTTRNQRVKLETLDVLNDLVRTIVRFALFVHLFERVRARRTEIRAAITIPTTHRLAIERQHFWRRIN